MWADGHPFSLQRTLTDLIRIESSGISFEHTDAPFFAPITATTGLRALANVQREEGRTVQPREF